MTTKSASLGIGQLLRVLRAHDAEGRTDGQLLERFLIHQDEAAFEALVRRHGPMVFGVCRRILGNDADSEDAFQATFLVLVRRAPSLTSRSILGDWLHGVARHTALKAKAAASHRQAKEQAMARPGATAEEVRNDWLPLLDEELARLPAKYRLPIVLCDLEGMTRHEAAKQLGWPLGTVAGRLARARTMLAKALARHGVMLSAGALAVAISQNATSACVPGSFVYSTVKAASMSAAGKAVAGVVSTQVAALTEGVLKAMLLTKLKTVTAVLLMLSMVALTNAIPAWSQTGDKGNTVESAESKAEKPEAKQAAKPKQAERDIDRFQGSWVLVSEEQDGKPQPSTQQKKIYTFAGENLSLTIEGGDSREPITNKLGFRLNPSKSPKEIDGQADGKPGMKGIYLLEGDTLKICVALPDMDRPATFLSRQGSSLMTLQKLAKATEGVARQRELADRSVTSKDEEKPVPIKDKEKEAGAKASPDRDFRNGLIQVQVTGLLVLPQWAYVADKDGQFQRKDSYSGSVRAEGRTLFLDCAGNKEARELVEKTVADLRKHTGYVPNIKLQVKGRLHFPPITVVREVDGKRIEHSETHLVIVVESVTVVE